MFIIFKYQRAGLPYEIENTQYFLIVVTQYIPLSSAQVLFTSNHDYLH